MRINKRVRKQIGYSIFILDDDLSITIALKSFFQSYGYAVRTSIDPEETIEILRHEPHDILLLDYLMSPLMGDEVVSQIRAFNKEMYIVLLTGHKDLAPPIRTIRELDIQGYYEKSDRFDQLMLLVESCVKSIAQMRTIQKYRDGLNTILNSVPMIYQLQPLDTIIHTILIELLPLVNSKDAFILVENAQTDNIQMANKSIFRGVGCFDLKVQDFIKELFPSLFDVIGQVRQSGESIDQEGFLIVPMKDENNDSIGVLGIRQSDEGISDTQIQLFEVFAHQAASAISNAFLHSLVNMKNQELMETYKQLRESYLQTVGALRLIVDAKDIYTRGHSDRVSYFCQKIAMKMGKNNGYIKRLHLSGLFHDVGKIGVADDILLKETELTAREYDEVKKHPQRGANILSAISFLDDISMIVKHHHERWDGKGYPNGLTGSNIPEESRIIAVADAFDAMTSERQYRHRLSLENAKKELIKGKGTQFDGLIVDIFIELLEHYDDINEEIRWTYDQIDINQVKVIYQEDEYE